MSQNKYNIAMVDEVYSSLDMLFLPALKHHDVWFLSACTRPASLIHRCLVEAGIQGLHLIGEFTGNGFKMAGNHVLSPDDFPAFDVDQSHRFITFWCNVTDNAKNIDEGFLGALLMQTKMSISTSIRTSEIGYSKTALKFTPPVSCISLTIK